MPENLLSDPTIRKAAPGEKPRKLSDGGGLVLEIRPGGGKWWRYRYQFGGKEKMLSLGTYPAVTLAEARRRRNEAREKITAGTDPSQARKEAKATQVQAQQVATLQASGEALPGTFEAVALAWLDIRRGEWAPKYFDKIKARLENDVHPYIGNKPVADVTPPDLLAVLRRIEARGAIESARRVRETCSLVFRFAIAEGKLPSDPARDLAGALKTHTTRHIPAITDPLRFGELLRSIDAYRGTSAVRTALHVLLKHLCGPCAAVDVRRCRLLLTHRLAINSALVPERCLVEPRRLAAGVVLDRDERAQVLVKHPGGRLGIEAKHLQPDVIAFNLDVEVNTRQPGQVLRVALEITNSRQVERARVDFFTLLDDVIEQPAE